MNFSISPFSELSNNNIDTLPGVIDPDGRLTDYGPTQFNNIQEKTHLREFVCKSFIEYSRKR